MDQLLHHSHLVSMKQQRTKRIDRQQTIALYVLSLSHLIYALYINSWHPLIPALLSVPLDRAIASRPKINFALLYVCLAMLNILVMYSLSLYQSTSIFSFDFHNWLGETIAYVDITVFTYIMCRHITDEHGISILYVIHHACQLLY